MTTALISPTYKDTVVKLMKEFNIYDIISFDPYFLPEAKATSPIWNVQQLLSSSGIPLEAVYKAANKYIDIYRDLFGNSEGELMLRPSPTVLQDHLQGSFLDFLIRNDLEALIGLFSIVNLFAGYK